MADPKITVENMTVSSMIELHRGGEKTQHFVSANFRLDPPVSIDEWPLHQLHAAYKVSVSIVHDALMRGVITVTDANDRIEILRDNYANMRVKLDNAR